MQETELIIRQFAQGSLYDACCALLRYLKVSFVEVISKPLPFSQLYPVSMSKALSEVAEKIVNTYYIGQVDARTLSGQSTGLTTEEIHDLVQRGKYHGMLVFAVDMVENCSLTRSEMAILTRGFNRIATAQPVILFIRQGVKLSLSTCERMEFSQQWREGEKLGKVSILRNINCKNPHHGQIDILEALGDKKYDTFDELYDHWMNVFSCDVLTEKFYSELSDWYAWASEVVRFPNDVSTGLNDDEQQRKNNQLNSEACIRMITRLIFVWFLYCKGLIPKQFFDKDYIHDNLIKDFSPRGDQPQFYNPDDSKYYRDILQNLFFAMLNCPIKSEGKGNSDNRRFRPRIDGYYKNSGYDINNLMRYEGDFMPGGTEKFLHLANTTVPFLNGGLFECLDDKPHHVYYDGFSEHKESLTRLYVPDYLFFGGKEDVNLWNWYHDDKKKHVAVSGLIDLFKRYYFTVEENTPLDQEVSLDPELLGKAFENLLAAYVPETGTNARKQTGSFYTPRPIVQYMVDESLVAHLKSMCGEKHEQDYYKLLSYSAEDIDISDEERNSIIKALYNCRVLDPACGSGAFPMGMLQQMVHVLKRVDPTNEKWKSLMIEQATQQSKIAFSQNDEQERRERLADIEVAFNQSINDPDYARKLYLIENCIYGVDIQPIAIQISKLRFFISLVVDQRPTSDAMTNFGIRPLPNLEAKFVAANTLIPITYDKTLVDGRDDVIKLKKHLKLLNHKIFLARRNTDKKRLKQEITNTRLSLADAVADSGFVRPGIADQLAAWDMFDQNSFSEFFDPEWMFGIKGEFDIVIANPPYKIVASNDPLKNRYNKIYKVAHGGKRNLYHLFYERGIEYTKPSGVLSYITPDTYLSGNDTKALREYLIKHTSIISIVLYSEKDKIFKNVTQAVAVMVLTRDTNVNNIFTIHSKDKTSSIEYKNLNENNKYVFKAEDAIISKMNKSNLKFGDICEGYKGDVNLALKKSYFTKVNCPETLPLVRGVHISKYSYSRGNEYCYLEALTKNETPKERIVFQEISNMGLAQRIKGTIIRNVICGDTCNLLYSKQKRYSNELILGVLNSNCVNYYFKFYNQTNHVPIGEIKNIPFPQSIESDKAQYIQSLVHEILNKKRLGVENDTSEEEVQIDCMVCHLYGLTYEEVLVVDPHTTITKEQYEAEESCFEA